MALFSILIPTRNRPRMLCQLLDSLSKNTARPSLVEVVIRYDTDDMVTRGLGYEKYPFRIKLQEGPRTTMGGLNTDCYQASSGEWMILANDDAIFHTYGWDIILEHATQVFPDQIALLHVRDGFKNEKFPMFPIMSRHVCELLEDPFPRCYSGDHIDGHWNDIFQKLKNLGHDRKVYIDSIYIEHLHELIGKSKRDEVYAQRDHVQDDYPFFALWKVRERNAERLWDQIEKKELRSLIRDSWNQKKSIVPLFQFLWHAKQPRIYKLKFFIYNILRHGYEIYLKKRKKRKLFFRRKIYS